MIAFSRTFPCKLHNVTGVSVCGIASGVTKLLGPAHMFDTNMMYDSWAEAVPAAIIDGSLVPYTADNYDIPPAEAAIAWQAARSDVSANSSCASVYVGNAAIDMLYDSNGAAGATGQVLVSGQGGIVSWNTLQSTTGPAGATGIAGIPGSNGVTGIAGTQGIQGATGISGGGSSIVTGPVGSVYTQGVTGQGWAPTYSIAPASTIIAKAFNTLSTNPLPTTRQWIPTCYSPELKLLVIGGTSASYYNIATTSDGITWTERYSSDNQASVFDIAWSPSLNIFATVGNTASAQCMSSPDGITWTNRSAGVPANNWTGVCWSPDKQVFIAVASSGTNNRCLYSSDGQSWNVSSMSYDYAWSDIIWSTYHQKYVAINSDGTNPPVMTSTDGNAGWGTISAATVGASGQWVSLDVNPTSGWIIMVEQVENVPSKIVRTRDFITWERINLPSSIQAGKIKYSAECNCWVIVGPSGTTRALYSLDDGATWTTFAASNVYYGVDYIAHRGVWTINTATSNAYTTRFMGYAAGSQRCLVDNLLVSNGKQLVASRTLQTLAAVTVGSVEPLIIPHGADPATPTNGAIWTTTTDTFVRQNGTTRALVNTAATQTLSAKTLSAPVFSGTSTGNYTHSGTLTHSNTYTNSSAGGVVARKLATTVQTSATTTGAIAYNLSTGSVMITTTQLTGNITVTLSNPVAGGISWLTLSMPNPVVTVTLAMANVNFFQSSSTNAGFGSIVLTNMSLVSSYYTIQLLWRSTTECYVAVL